MGTMEIKKMSSYLAQVAQQMDLSAVRTAEDGKATNVRDGQVPPDRVDFSREAQEMAQVKKVMMERDELRAERVDHLQQMVENRTYKVEPEEIAARMLDELI
jgi:flagellar biosynthesis anti-sigma factor FlgM